MHVDYDASLIIGLVLLVTCLVTATITCFRGVSVWKNRTELPTDCTLRRYRSERLG